jgi:glycosyltransferase involved in cell wall biosynthesis
MFGDTPFTVIYNGIDADAFCFSETNREMIRRKYDIPESAFVIGHTGTLSELKNQELLIRIFPDILKVKKDAYLLLIGRDQNKLQEYLESLARQYGINEKVIFTGAVMNVNEYLSAFDVFAFPSLREGTPISLIEAQANGLPCVISDRIPRDAVITDLVKTVPLDKREQWVSFLCQSARKDSEQYASFLNNHGYGIYSAMEQLYLIYRGN